MLDKRFAEYENFVFDLDGTVWKWTALIPGALKVFQILKRMEKNIFFVTNNVLLTREGFAKKLQNFGISAKAQQIFNSSLPAVQLCKGKKVFCFGEGLVTELRKEKIRTVEGMPDIVLMGEDRNITYDKLSKASSFVVNGSKFYKTAIGSIFIYGDKKLPGVGAIAKAVEYTCGKEAELIGKPSKYMQNILKELKLEPAKTILFGDECGSDIIFGNRLGFKTVLVLSGRDTEGDYLAARGELEPSMVLKSIAEIVK